MKSTRTRPLLAALAATAVAVTGVVTSVAAAPSAEAAPATIRVITHNIAKKPTALTKVIEVAKSDRMPGPEVVFLQEVCQSMLPRIKDKLGPYAFHIRRTNQGDCSDGVIGEAVVYTKKDAFAEDSSVDFGLASNDGQTYGMACLNISLAGRATRACSTHLPSAKGADRDALRLQATRVIRDKARAWNTKELILVGGDFNSVPTAASMNPMYGVGSGSQGDFREISQTAGSGSTARAGRFTIGKVSQNTDRKVDYVFAWKAATRASGGWADTRFTPSNHRMLFGGVPLS